MSASVFDRRRFERRDATAFSINISSIEWSSDVSDDDVPTSDDIIIVVVIGCLT